MAEFEKNLRMDDSVIVAYMIQGRPMAVHCVVTSEAPTYLFTKDQRILNVEYPQSVVLVWHRDEQIMKGEGRVVEVHPWKNGNVLEIRQTVTHDIDRRIYPRFPIETSVSLRAVADVSGATVISLCQGSTKDISLGGAWIDVQPTVPMGSIVECKFNFFGEEIGTLAIVAHENPNRGGNGLEFLDFYGDSKDKLNQLLKRAA